MKNLYLIFLLGIIGCSSLHKSEKSKCPEIYKNNYSEILNEKYKSIVDGDTITINEIRFECVYSALYTHKVMYDKFGNWNDAIYPSNKNHPILVWKNIDLFSNGKKYDIYTNGLEEWKHIYSSVMVFDNNNNDLLSENSSEKEKLTQYFSNLIIEQNHSKRDFYDKYWAIVNQGIEIK